MGQGYAYTYSTVREYSAYLPLPGQSPKRSARESLPVPNKPELEVGEEYVDKAIAYITRGDRFVVFEEPETPSAGIQVPGGTVEPGETLEAAVLREAEEETGLSQLSVVRALGVQLHRRPSGRIHRRHYFHLVDSSDLEREVWEHYEEHPHSGSAPILYRLRWACLREPPALHAELDGGFHQLRLGLARPQRKLRRVGLEQQHAARALVFDGAQRVLLLRSFVNGRCTWVAPGGTVTGDESYTCALRRVLAEELRLRVGVGPVVMMRRFSGEHFEGGAAEVTEVYFRGHIQDSEVPSTRSDRKAVGHRWWSLDELSSSKEHFAPRGLPSLLPTILAHDGSGGPIDVGF